MHALGHEFDYFELDDDARAAFERLIGRPGDPWRGQLVGMGGGGNNPVEQFAEAWRLCAISSTRLDRSTVDTLTYSPSLRTHRRACAFIRRQALRSV